MKPFRFGLERVLKLREYQTELRLADWARENKVLISELEKLSVFENEGNAQVSEMRVSGLKSFAAWSRSLDFKYLCRIGKVIAFQSEQVEKQRVQAERSKQVYIAARRQEDALDKLREKQVSDWRLGVIREEQKELDDRFRMKPEEF